jgi:hypothetical protein
MYRKNMAGQTNKETKYLNRQRSERNVRRRHGKYTENPNKKRIWLR